VFVDSRGNVQGGGNGDFRSLIGDAGEHIGEGAGKVKLKGLPVRDGAVVNVGVNVVGVVGVSGESGGVSVIGGT